MTTQMYDCIEERLLYSLILFLWRLDVPVGCYILKCVDYQPMTDKKNQDGVWQTEKVPVDFQGIPTVDTI